MDDCSRDKTFERACQFKEVKVFKMPKNMGKGAAVQHGIAQSEGNYVLVQDADLEYNPDDYIPMLKAHGPGKSVYGSRVLKTIQESGPGLFCSKHKNQQFGPWLAGRFLSIWAFFFLRTWISDTLTDYKIYPTEILRKFHLKTKRFETNHELTAKLIKSRIKIIEVPINYISRTE